MRPLAAARPKNPSHRFALFSVETHPSQTADSQLWGVPPWLNVTIRAESRRDAEIKEERISERDSFQTEPLTCVADAPRVKMPDAPNEWAA